MATKKAAPKKVVAKKKATLAKKAAPKASKRSVKDMLLAEHKPFGEGDTVEVVYIPFRGDVFGSTGGPPTDSCEVGYQYEVVSYNKKTGHYTLQEDGEEMAWTLPFYALKLVRKNDGRSLYIGSHFAYISADGKKIDVGCEYGITAEKVKKVYDMMVAVQKKYKKPAKKAPIKKPAKKRASRRPYAAVIPAM